MGSIFGWSWLFIGVFLALRADPEDFEQMRDLRVAKLARHALQPIRHAHVQGLRLVAGTAHDVMVMVIAGIDLVAIGGVAEVAPAHRTALFHHRQAAVNGHQVTSVPLHPLVQFLRGEGAMLAGKNTEDRLARLGHALVIRAQQIQRGFQLGIGIGSVVRHPAFY